MRPKFMRDENLIKQYESADNLSARIALHARYSQSPVPWMRWLFDRLALKANAHVLEVGAGSMLLWRENADRVPESWTLTLTDNSPGMLAEGRALLASVAPDLEARASYGIVDAERLPFQDGAFDAVIANHMLYHVPDRPRALAAFARVLKPGGRLIASTNGQRHMAELCEAPNQDDPAWFALENGGAEIAAVFGECVREDFKDELRVTDIRDLIAYHRSYEVLTPEREAAITAYYDARRDSAGTVHITKSVGLFTAVRRERGINYPSVAAH